MHREFQFLACEMFQTFARFEYALKVTGFVSANASADWTKFANEPSVKDLFIDANIELQAAREYLAMQPPKKQINLDGRLSWGEELSNSTADSKQILEHVRRVRNNLFHGGKETSQSERDKLLLRHSLTILKECLKANPKLNDAFHSSPFWRVESS